jgi:hypothetical protein
MSDSVVKASVFSVEVDNVQFGWISLNRYRRQFGWSERERIKISKNILMRINILSIIDVMFAAPHRVFTPMKMELEKVETVC